ncbi:hypothetical protein BDDG_04865 [Blastomyces dermatitidis ATCC 18188]|uniref:Uncharacterized protein n=1 Tax=Ajellomyces dermatitidis (strain ATCC 18188 / CBS 674.68) TaxID=653446 RepID=F2TFA9_AJEDA|nr:hypothetical protein BDDG_04865 [Blastomyces dermatitidis ATCC 18188]
MKREYSPQQVRGSSQLSSSEWDELPDRLGIEHLLEKFTLPRDESPRSPRHDEDHLGAAGHRNGPTEGAQFGAHSVMNHHANGSGSFASAPIASTEVKQEEAEPLLFDGNPFGYTFALHSGFNNNTSSSTQNFPTEQRVDASLIDPQIIGTSSVGGSPKPRPARVLQSSAQHIMPSTTATMRDEIPGTGSFQCTSSYENTRSSSVFSVFSADTTSAYPTPSSDSPSRSSSSFPKHPAGHTTMEAGNPLLTAADLLLQQPFHHFSDIMKFHVPAQTERFLTSIEMLTTQARESMFLLHRQHELAFTFYIHIQSLEHNFRLHQWGEYLDNMRFQCVNIRDGLIGALKNICWGFAEWMGVYKDELPCGIVLRARDALRQASELKAMIDRFAYPTWQEMVAKEAVIEQPANISGLEADQLFGDFVNGDGVMPNH